MTVCVAASLFFGPSPPAPPQYAAYMKARAEMLHADQADWMGGGLDALSPLEVEADKVLRYACTRVHSATARSAHLPPCQGNVHCEIIVRWRGRVR